MELDSKSKKEIGKRFRKAREQQKLTQAEIAKESGISTGYYARIERGEEQPSLTTIKILVKTLKVKAGDVLPF